MNAETMDMSPEARTARYEARMAATAREMAAKMRESDARYLALHRFVMIHCDCGHEAPEGHVMSTSRGTACLSCYDRMSI